MTTASISSPLNLQLPKTPDNLDPNLYPDLAKIYNALQQIQVWMTEQTEAIARDSSIVQQLTPTDTIKTQNLNRIYVQAAVNLAFGDIVSYTKSGGAYVARKADATAAVSRQAQGFVTEVGGILAGAYGETQAAIGLCQGIAGLTAGTSYYLSTTPGLITATKPVAPNLIQPVGFALDSALLYFFAPPI